MSRKALTSNNNNDDDNNDDDNNNNQAGNQLGLPNAPVYVDKVYIERLTNITHNHFHIHEGTTATPPGIGTRQDLAQRTPHANHHVHSKVIQKDSKTIFRCSGCKELGRGDRYVCEHCPYVHHLNCTGYKETETHKFFKGSTFKFHQQRFDKIDRHCDACGLDINELSYHSEKKGLDLHPFCINLQEEVYPEGIKYKLCKKMNSRCGRCFSKKNAVKDGFWWYYSSSSNKQCHVSCMMDYFITK